LELLQRGGAIPTAVVSKSHILIAGAGIGGIVAALVLRQHGFEISLYEQAAELHELGAGQLAPLPDSHPRCADCPC
jgi:NADPH-dependent 2,4-dienoyl-CoA reductase/sulfur reductase-like enzyme